MGRPINNKYIGNTSQSGQQLQATAFIPGMASPTTAYIVKQTATNTYNMANISGPESGSAQLVNGGVSLLPGQANITVTPYGSGGSGATAVANLAINAARVGVGGTGTPAAYYVPSEVLSVTGGTSSVAGTLSVGAVKAGNVLVNAGAGPGYTVGDSFTWAHAGFDVAPVLTVASVTGNGNISTMSITVPGTVTNVNVTNTTPFTSSVQANAWATGATFAIRWDVNSFGIANRGNYTAAPGNNVATSGSTLGTGATAVLDWEVASARVTNGGTGYQAAQVTFSTGNAQALATVNAAGSITGIEVTAAGSGYGNVAPTMSVTPIGSVQYAQEIRNRSVTTFDGNTYEWSMTGVTLTSSNQATIQSS